MHKLSLKPANKPVCPGCKQHVWYVSQVVVRRLLNCEGCRRSYLYFRNLDNIYSLDYVGRFKTHAAMTERTLDYAKDFS